MFACLGGVGCNGGLGGSQTPIALAGGLPLSQATTQTHSLKHSLFYVLNTLECTIIDSSEMYLNSFLETTSGELELVVLVLKMLRFVAQLRSYAFSVAWP